MEQCLYCQHRLFFKPLSNETFTCCFAYGEGVQDINIRTGVSPAIKKYGLDGNPCEKFELGTSAFQSPVDNPFYVHPTRKAGEEFFFKILTQY